jgi:GNAT superfamily N-acetyltransferase
MRVFHSKRHIAPSELARLTQIDYEREMAFIVTTAGHAEREETLGVIRTVTDPENVQAEFAIIVRSDLKGRGLGGVLFHKMIRYCRSRGTQTLVGDVLWKTDRCSFMRQLGFTRALLRRKRGTCSLTYPA